MRRLFQMLESSDNSWNHGMPSHGSASGMHARGAIALAALVLGVCLSGCGAGRDLKGSMTAYERGNYHRALDRCEMVDESDLDDKAQVRYFVYCGLAYYKVGRPADARQLLANGQKLYANGDPEWLKPLIVDAMQKAIENLNLAAQGPVVAVPAVPVATVQAPTKRAPQSSRDDQYE